jgi:acetylornithine/succinyldiaminopimelate/putrescine aminotransferase
MPLVPGVHYAEFNDIDSVKALISDKTAGVFIEPIQGEGGLYPADPEFMRELRALCDKHDAMLITDEVQCGLGRSGTLFAHEAYDVTPDIMTLAKPLAGGLPIGAVLMSNKVASAITPGQHGTTFGGNPLVCAVANTVLNKIMDEDFLANVQKRGKYLADRLEKLQQKFPDKVADVRKPIGKGGLFVALECTKPVGPLITYALSKQVLIISAGEKCVCCAPLTCIASGVLTIVGLCLATFSRAAPFVCARPLSWTRRTSTSCSTCSSQPSRRAFCKVLQFCHDSQNGRQEKCYLGSEFDMRS